VLRGGGGDGSPEWLARSPPPLHRSPMVLCPQPMAQRARRERAAATTHTLCADDADGNLPRCATVFGGGRDAAHVRDAEHATARGRRRPSWWRRTSNHMVAQPAVPAQADAPPNTPLRPALSLAPRHHHVSPVRWPGAHCVARSGRGKPPPPPRTAAPQRAVDGTRGGRGSLLIPATVAPPGGVR